MRLQGSAHITDDVDVSYARDIANLTQLASALKKHKGRLRGVPEDLPFILDAQTFRNTLNLTLVTDLGSLDLLGEPAGVESFEGLWERSAAMEVDGIEVHVASVDDLLAMKRAANRPKDQNHILELEALRRLLNADSD